jgi:hypothetical protein
MNNIMHSIKKLLKNSCILFFLVVSLSLELIAQTYGTLPAGGTGYVSGLIFSKTVPGLKYIRTDVGGAYRRDDDNSSWIPLNDWASSNETGYLGVESLALDPNDPDKLYMSVGISYFNNGKSAILRSSDRGRTFSKTDITSLFKVDGNGMGRNTGEKLVVDPNLGSILFCGSRANGLFKSTDSGASWARVSSLDVTTTATGNGISFVLFDPSSADSGFVSQTIITGVSRIGENMYRSDDGGANFFPVTGAPASLMPNRCALSGDGNLYITYTNKAGPWDPGDGQVWKYNLSSGNWTNVTPASYGVPFGGICVDPGNPQRVVLSSINVYRLQGGGQWGDIIFLSNDGGANWLNKITSGYKFDPNGVEWAKNGCAIHWAGSIEFDPFNTKRVSVISGNGVFTTDNIDSTTNLWKFDVYGLEESVPLDMISIPGGPVVTVIGDYDGFKYKDITKYGKQNLPAMGTTNGIAYAGMNPKYVVRAGKNLYFSSDTAKTWKLATLKNVQGHVSLSADGVVLLHSPENLSATYRSTDKGMSWTNVSGLAFSGARTVADQVNSKVFYSYNTSTGIVMVSVDGGISFYPSGTVGTGGSRHIRTVPGFEGDLWIALYNGGLTRSSDYGAKFTKIVSVNSCSAVGFGKAAPGSEFPTVFIWGKVVGIEGLYYSTNQGNSWNRINDDAHEWGGPGNGQFVIGDMNTLGLVYMSTAGRGIVYAKADIMLSSALNIMPSESIQMYTSILNTDTLSWTWTSGSPLIAEVDSNGVVTGIKQGSAVITATNNNGISLKTIINVLVPVKQITISPQKDSIEIAEEVQLTAEVSPADASKSVLSWSSVNPSVATISISGLLKGIKKGSTIITVISGDNKKVSFPLVVKEPDPTGSLLLLSEEIRIFPNPVTDGNFTIILGGLSGLTSVRLLDVLGSTVLDQVFHNEKEIQFDTELKPGIYVVRIENEKKSVIRKFVVEN